MVKTADGFQCQEDRCGITTMDGHGAEIVDDGGVITIHIKRDDS